MTTSRISDLTVEELLELVRHAVRDVLAETQQTSRSETGKRPPLDLPVIDVGRWPDTLSLRREDWYGDDER
jgi:hypothetical protein